MNVLLSIKPIYVKEIINGNKRYEFRKSLFNNHRDIAKVFIYSTSPQKKVVGYFKIGKIVKDAPEELWKKYKDMSGMDEDDFFGYFNGYNEGFAIKIKSLHIFDEFFDPEKLIPNFVPPQSFRYIDDLMNGGVQFDKELSL
jgi:predicted transcriptional regulator